MTSKYGKWKPNGKTIGQGGQGQILLVTNEKYPNETFALKKLTNINRIDRFKDEISASFKLNHSNIIKIIDYKLDDNPFMVMDYFEKKSLDELDLNKISFEKKMEIFEKICEAIAFAHGNEPLIIHRDLKPENIFLKDNLEPVIGDFGLCFIDEEGERFTLTEEAVGSIKYIAPELEEGKIEEIAPSSDIYSLGKILYWLLTGKVFSREKHRDETFNLSKFIHIRESELINELLDKMITSSPRDRFDNAENALLEFKSTIQRIKQGNNPIDSEILQTCIYCGKGNYRKIVHDEPNDGHQYSSTKNFGFRAVGAPSWIIFTCDYCGNVQIFRPDYNNENKWINKD